MKRLVVGLITKDNLCTAVPGEFPGYGAGEDDSLAGGMGISRGVPSGDLSVVSGIGFSTRGR